MLDVRFLQLLVNGLFFSFEYNRDIARDTVKTFGHNRTRASSVLKSADLDEDEDSDDPTNADEANLSLLSPAVNVFHRV